MNHVKRTFLLTSTRVSVQKAFAVPLTIFHCSISLTRLPHEQGFFFRMFFERINFYTAVKPFTDTVELLYNVTLRDRKKASL